MSLYAGSYSGNHIFFRLIMVLWHLNNLYGVCVSLPLSVSLWLFLSVSRSLSLSFSHEAGAAHTYGGQRSVCGTILYFAILLFEATSLTESGTHPQARVFSHHNHSICLSTLWKLRVSDKLHHTQLLRGCKGFELRFLCLCIKCFTKRAIPLAPLWWLVNPHTHTYKIVFLGMWNEKIHMQSWESCWQTKYPISNGIWEVGARAAGADSAGSIYLQCLLKCLCKEVGRDAKFRWFKIFHLGNLHFHIRLERIIN